MYPKYFLSRTLLSLGLAAATWAPLSVQAQAQHDGSAARPLRSKNWKRARPRPVKR